MSSTHEINAVNAFSALIRKDVLTPICLHMTSKGYQVTVDELANLLQLPAPAAHSVMPSGIPSVVGVSSLPNIAGLSGIVPAAGAGKRGRGKKTPVSEEEQCRYIFTRGKDKDTRCPNRRADGDHNFCNACKGKKTAQEQLGQGGTAKSVPMPSGPLPMSNQLMAGGGLMATKPETKKLQVVAMSGGQYKEKNHNLCLRPGGKPGEFVCCGVYSADGSSVNPLTPEMQEICKNIGLSYVDPSRTATVPAPHTGLPSLPRAGTTLPSALPSAGGLPKLPSASTKMAPTVSVQEDDDEDAGEDDEDYVEE